MPDNMFCSAYEWDVLSDRLEWFGKIHEKLGYAQDEIPLTI